MPTFDTWFAGLFGQQEMDVKRLLNDGGATRFLIAWSMFESRCFDDTANEERSLLLADRIVTDEAFDADLLSDALIHFYDRYQSASRLSALLHKRKSIRFSQLLCVPLEDLSNVERTFFVMFVVFRFRNDIFHGNKGVESWLHYREQIRLCTEAMQALISHVQTVKQTISV